MNIDDIRQNTYAFYLTRPVNCHYFRTDVADRKAKFSNYLKLCQLKEEPITRKSSIHRSKGNIPMFAEFFMLFKGKKIPLKEENS